MGLGNVTECQISYAVEYAAQALRYPDIGIPLKQVDTHSLRLGGACALKLSGHSDTKIMKVGRWKPNSTSFLEYIQQQLSTFLAGMSTKMSRIAKFTNMEGAVTKEDLRPLTIF